MFAAAPEIMVRTNLINLLLFAALLWQIYNGRNWARIVLTAMFILGLLMVPFLFEFVWAQGTFAGMVLVVQTGIGALSLLLLYRPESSKWFKRRPLIVDSTVDEERPAS